MADTALFRVFRAFRDFWRRREVTPPFHRCVFDLEQKLVFVPIVRGVMREGVCRCGKAALMETGDPPNDPHNRAWIFKNRQELEDGKN